MSTPQNQTHKIYLTIAKWIAQQKQQRTVVIGITGAQGSGKSTLCKNLKPILEQVYHFRTVILALDDLYHTKSQRKQLAMSIHPLFQSRGVPGTHDVKFGISLIHSLMTLKFNQSLQIPTFSKSVDDRLPQKDWQNVEGPVDIILFEGWCLGACPQPDKFLAEPINELEKTEDVDGSWRQRINQFLREDYQSLFKLIDKLIMIRVPSFDIVFQHRLLQEQTLASQLQSQQSSTQTPTMKPNELQRFIMHFERISKQMLNETPKLADMVLAVDQDHQLTLLKMK